MAKSKVFDRNAQSTAQFVNVPGASGKIILKLDLWQSDQSLSFNFKSLDEREQVKGYLSSRIGTSAPDLAPVSTQSSQQSTKLRPEEIQARQSLLLKDPHLAKCHREYVVQGGLLSEEEFLDTRQVCSLSFSQFVAITARSIMDERAEKRTVVVVTIGYQTNLE